MDTPTPTAAAKPLATPLLPTEDAPGLDPAPPTEPEVREAPPANRPLPANRPAPAIEAIGLTKHYGRLTAIEDVTFRVEQGEVVGFLGPNGAGKSTTMRILTGLMTADRGSATVAGFSVAAEPAKVQGSVGFLSEHNPLPEDLRVGEYLRWRGKLRGLSGRRLRQREAEVKERCGLDPRTCRKLIASLSKGFRQRVGIAEVLLAEPAVVIMDEPTIGLDPHQIRAMRNLIQGLRERHSVILSSHILPEIEACCDRVVIIDRGRIVAQGAPCDLRAKLLPQQRLSLVTDASESRLRSLLDGVTDAHSPTEAVTVAPLAPPDADGFTSYEITAPCDLAILEPLLAAAYRQGCRIREAAPLRATLEDVFLAATRRHTETPGR